MKNISKKNFKFICAVFAAFLTFSCASTPKTENVSSDSYQDAESEKPQNDNADAEEKAEETEKQLDSSFQNKSENESSKNPLETIIEQNFSGEITINEDKNQNTSENSEEISSEKQSEPQKENKQDSDEQTEKIDSKDLLSDSENQTAPTADEQSKIPEPEVSEIFEEPEVIDAEAESENPENLNQTEQQEQIAEPEPEPISEKEETQSDSTQSEENTQAEPEISETNGTENPEKREPEEQNSESEKEIAEIVPSRSVTIKRNQFLDVVYPGNGWIYLGEDGTQLLRYFGRRIGQGNSTFSFRSSKEGNAILHFYKNDALTGNFIDDYLEVIVEDEVFRGNARARAPDYAEIVPPKFEKRRENAEINQKTETESESQNQNLDSTQISADKNGFTQTESGTKQEKQQPQETVSQNENQNAQNQENSAEKSKLSENQNSRQSPSGDNVQTVISNTDSGAQKAQTQTQNQAQTETHSTQFYTQNPAETQNEEENQNLAENVEAEPEVQVESEETENAPQVDESILDKAKQLFEEKKYAESLENVQNYINGASTRLDEAYYLLGQLYESNSSIKNIRNAVDAYDTVTKNYPLSKLWRNANQRSIYLKRFYIDIR